MSEDRAGRPLRLLWLGTYESDYTRTRTLMAGLREAGVDVIECHRPLWELTRHKAGGFLSLGRLGATGARFLRAWGGLAREQRRLGPVDAVVAGYPYQPDALPAWIFARGRRVPLIADAMISLSDTLAGDRARVGNAGGTALATLDRVTFGCADVVIVDTESHADYFEESFGVPRERMGIVRLGAETAIFKPAPLPPGEPRALFYGKLSPMHGLETIVRAARVEGTPPVRLIGGGQLEGWLADEIEHDPPARMEHLPWVEHERLGEELAAAGICLGIFGESAKAARVVPNKVYHAMSVGRPIITADTPAIREVLEHDQNALLVPAGDHDALAAAMIRLAKDQGLCERLGKAARSRFLEVGSEDAVARDFLTAIRRSAGV